MTISYQLLLPKFAFKLLWLYCLLDANNVTWLSLKGNKFCLFLFYFLKSLGKILSYNAVVKINGLTTAHISSLLVITYIDGD